MVLQACIAIAFAGSLDEYYKAMNVKSFLAALLVTHSFSIIKMWRAH